MKKFEISFEHMMLLLFGISVFSIGIVLLFVAGNRLSGESPVAFLFLVLLIFSGMSVTTITILRIMRDVVNYISHSKDEQEPETRNQSALSESAGPNTIGPV